MTDLDIHPEKHSKEFEEVVVLMSVAIFNRKEYDGLKVKKIAPCKVIDDWGVTLKEVHPMVFFGPMEAIEGNLFSQLGKELKRYDFEKGDKNGQH